MSEIIRLDNVEKYYLAQKRGLIDSMVRVPKIFVKALDGVSISMERGGVVAIVGESGSGKTTMGKIITTLERPTKGDVYFEGGEPGIEYNFPVLFGEEGILAIRPEV